MVRMEFFSRTIPIFVIKKTLNSISIDGCNRIVVTHYTNLNGICELMLLIHTVQYKYYGMVYTWYALGARNSVKLMIMFVPKMQYNYFVTIRVMRTLGRNVSYK